VLKADVDLEFHILRTICSKRNYSQNLLSSLTEDHFSTEITHEIFSRASSLLLQKGYLPTWPDLTIDPALPSIARKAVKQYLDIKPIRQENIDSSFGSLNQLRQIRALIDLGVTLQDSLESKKFDIDSTVTDLMNGINKVIEGVSASRITNVGEEDNSIQIVENILSGEGLRFIPTGFKAFDNVNNGFPPGAYVLLSGTTGSGKSALAAQLSDNIAMSGARIGIVPLEMSTEESIQRNLSRIAQVDGLKLLKPLEHLSKQKREEALQTYKNYILKLKKRGGKITYIEPSFAPSMEKLLHYVEPMGLDVLVIDYVGLLDGVNDENQAKKLSGDAAYAKRWAEKNKCVVIALSQLSEEGLVRYSRGMVEHASYSWTWKTPEDKTQGMLSIQQPKVRFGSSYPFLLKIDYSTMTVRDPTDDEVATLIDSQKKEQTEKWTPRKREKERNYDDPPKSKSNGSEPHKRDKPKSSKFNF
jgi:replicative DNA helicase